MDDTMIHLLDACSAAPDDHVPKLVAADRCQELGPSHASLEYLLRRLAAPGWESTPRLLFTGSRRYGTPRPGSDWDWVAYLDHRDMRDLEGRADSAKDSDGAGPKLRGYDVSVDYGAGGIDLALRFGPVNLLCVTAEPQWEAWVRGTALLADMGSRFPVTRRTAVTVFTEIRRQLGLVSAEA